MIFQRLNHADTNLPYGITERKAFSLRQERELKYEIMVQTKIDEEWQVFTTGYSRQKFGITKKSCQSEVSYDFNVINIDILLPYQ